MEKLRWAYKKASDTHSPTADNHGSMLVNVSGHISDQHTGKNVEDGEDSEE